PSHFSGRANDNSCPSGSSKWKYRSPQEAFCGFSGSNPSSLKRLQSASASATWKMSRPQPLTRSPCSKLRMAESASLACSDETVVSAVEQLQPVERFILRAVGAV